MIIPNRSKTITVFGSSRPAAGSADYGEAHDLGAALAKAGFGVCTGGYGGVMEAVSRGASEAGGRVLGVTASTLRSPANEWVAEEMRVATWQERLFTLVRMGDGFVACKGGTGTLVELAIVWEMMNKKATERRPLVILGDFWRPIVERVSEVEGIRASNADESADPLVYPATSIVEATQFLASRLGK